MDKFLAADHRARAIIHPIGVLLNGLGQPFDNFLLSDDPLLGGPPAQDRLACEAGAASVSAKTNRRSG
jgi:hypothetical protein